MSSFWIAWILIVTFGWSLVYAATVSSQYFLPSPVVELCQNVIVTGVVVSAGAGVLFVAPPVQPAAMRATPALRAISAVPLTVFFIETSQSSSTVAGVPATSDPDTAVRAVSNVFDNVFVATWRPIPSDRLALPP